MLVRYCKYNVAHFLHHPDWVVGASIKGMVASLTEQQNSSAVSSTPRTPDAYIVSVYVCCSCRIAAGAEEGRKNRRQMDHRSSSSKMKRTWELPLALVDAMFTLAMELVTPNV